MRWLVHITMYGCIVLVVIGVWGFAHTHNKMLMVDVLWAILLIVWAQYLLKKMAKAKRR